MKAKPCEALNTKFSEYERSLLVSYATFELLKFENRTEMIKNKFEIFETSSSRYK